jgi:hypothetical protein
MHYWNQDKVVSYPLFISQASHRLLNWTDSKESFRATDIGGISKADVGD